jgi:hypothetical protein
MPTRPRFTPQIQTAGQSNLSVYVRCPDFPQNIESAAAVCSLIFIDLQRQGNRGRINLLRGTLYRTNDLLSLCVFFFSIFGRMIGRWRCRFSPWCSGICLVRWESNFNTSAIGSLNSDGSLDHGLFQISDLFWCDHQQGMDSACGLTCESIIIYSLTNSFKLKKFQKFSVGIIYISGLRNEDIKDDVICAKRIFRQHQHLTGNGFNAWYGSHTMKLLLILILVTFLFLLFLVQLKKYRSNQK